MVLKTILIAAIITYVEARFSQEQVPIPVIAALKGGASGVAPTIAGATISNLLAAANSCDKLVSADKVVTQLGGGADAIAAAIALVAAEKNTNPFVNGNAQKVCADPSLPATQALRGITPLIDPAVDTNGAAAALSKTTQSAPLDATGLSVFDLMQQAGLGDLVVGEAKAGGIVGGGSGGNSTGNANPNGNGNGKQNGGNLTDNANPNGNGNGNGNAKQNGNGNGKQNGKDNGKQNGKQNGNGNEQAKGNQNNNGKDKQKPACANPGRPVAPSGGNADAGNGKKNANDSMKGKDNKDNQGNKDNQDNNTNNNNEDNKDQGKKGKKGKGGQMQMGSGNLTSNANGNNPSANGANTPPASVNTPAAGPSTGAGGEDFGRCTPTIFFAGGQNGRAATEFTFQISDPLARGGQQEALNPNIITNALCNQLVNVCDANAAAVAKCLDAKAQVAAAGTRDQSTADLFNSAIGFPTAKKLRRRQLRYSA